VSKLWESGAFAVDRRVKNVWIRGEFPVDRLARDPAGAGTARMFHVKHRHGRGTAAGSVRPAAIDLLQFRIRAAMFHVERCLSL
jgi:hypothetical protein